MPLRFRNTDTNSVQTLKSAITAIRPSAKPVMRTVGKIFPIDRITEINDQVAFPVYTLGPDEVANPRLQLDAVLQTGWLYLIDQDLSATVSLDNLNQHKFSSFTRSKLPEKLTNIVVQIQAHTLLEDKNMELRLLNIPSLYTYALWLKNETPNTNDDLIAAVLTDQSSLEEGKIYGVLDFFKILRKNEMDIG